MGQAVRLLHTDVPAWVFRDGLGEHGERFFRLAAAPQATRDGTRDLAVVLVATPQQLSEDVVVRNGVEEPTRVEKVMTLPVLV